MLAPFCIYLTVAVFGLHVLHYEFTSKTTHIAPTRSGVKKETSFPSVLSLTP